MTKRPPDPDQPILLMQAPNDFEAQVVAQALNAEGIRAGVVGSHTAGWFGAGNPLATVGVMVRRADRAEAFRVLRELRAEARGTSPAGIDGRGRCVVCGYDMAGLDERPVCPECGTNLADESALHAAPTDGSMLRSGAMRVLIVLILLALAVAFAVSGIDYMMKP